MRPEWLRSEVRGGLHRLRQHVRQIGRGHCQLRRVQQRVHGTQQRFRQLRSQRLRTALQFGLHRMRREVRGSELCFRPLRDLHQEMR